MSDYRNFFIGKAQMLTKKGKSEKIWARGNSMKTAIEGYPYIAVFIWIKCSCGKPRFDLVGHLTILVFVCGAGS